MARFAIVLQRFVKWALDYPKRVMALFLCTAAVFALFYHLKTVAALEKELRNTRNQLSDSIGTIEIADGIYARQGMEIRNLGNKLEELLGENTRLSGLVDDRDTRVAVLVQANATLTDRLRFTSRGQNNQPIIEVIDNCPPDGIDPEEETSEWIPNIKIEHSFEQDGWAVEVLAYTNPALVNVELRQTIPYYLEAAVTILPDGTEQLVIAEQTGRLQFEIGEFAIDRRTRRLRWYELIGFGVTGAWTPGTPQLGLALQVETRGRIDFSVGPLWNLRTGATGTHATISFRPFKRQR
jgi:hypothetical protein